MTRRSVVVLGLAVVIAAVLISPALGGPSLKKLVRSEVRKQLRNKQGPAGTSFDANATLPSRQTLSGVWVLQGGGGGANTPISFIPRLPADLGGAFVHRITGTSAECPGPGTAAAGHLCVYERASSLAGPLGIFNPATGAPGADRRGAQISYSGTTGTAVGTWAVTAP